MPIKTQHVWRKRFPDKNEVTMLRMNTDIQFFRLQIFSYCIQTCIFFTVFVRCNQNLEQCSSEADPAQERMDQCNTASPVNNEQALVLYDETFLTPFQKDERTFNFVQRKLTIPQDWGNLGVAAVVWDAAIVLCEYLEKGEIEIKNKSVIELGAGSGIVGIVASLLGAKVTVTERKAALEYLNKVVNINLRNDVTKVGDHDIKVRELDWTDDLKDYKPDYDIILGADIIYIEDLFPDLLKTLLHLSNEKTLILISCHLRYDRDQQFLNMMKEKFTTTEVYFDKDRNIHIYQAQKISS